MGDRQGLGRMRLEPRSQKGIDGWIKRVRAAAGFLAGMEFMYDPQTVRDSRSVTWDDSIEPGATEGPLTFKKGLPRELSMTLMLDEYGRGNKARTAEISKNAIFPDAYTLQRYLSLKDEHLQKWKRIRTGYNMVEKTIAWLDWAMTFDKDLESPPPLVLIWRRGDAFWCILTRREVTWQVMEPGTYIPLRATVDITLREHIQE